MASKQRFSLEVEESVLQCIIHRGVMEDPRLLQCHHSFCLGCLEKWYRQGGRTYQGVQCPACRKVTILRPGAGISSLPIDFRLNTLKDLLHNNSKSPKSIEYNALVLCDICQTDGNETEASWQCYQCRHSLCAQCKKRHSQRQHLKSHSMVEMDGEIRASFLCKVHVEDFVTYYCKTCSNLVCGKCLLGGHKDHSVCDLDGGATTLKTSLMTRREQLAARAAQLADILNELSNYRQNAVDKKIQDTIGLIIKEAINRSSHILANTDPSQIDTERVMQIVQSEKRLLEELRNRQTEVRKQLMVQEEGCKLSCSTTRHLLKMTEERMQDSDGLPLVACYESLVKRIDKCLSEEVTVPPELRLPSLIVSAHNAADIGHFEAADTELLNLETNVEVLNKHALLSTSSAGAASIVSNGKASEPICRSGSNASVASSASSDSMWTSIDSSAVPSPQTTDVKKVTEKPTEKTPDVTPENSPQQFQKKANRSSLRKRIRTALRFNKVKSKEILWRQEDKGIKAPMKSPTDLAFLPNDMVAVTSHTSKSLVIFNNDGKLHRSVDLDSAKPWCVCSMSAEEFGVLDTVSKSIKIYDTTFHEASALHNNALETPRGLAVNLYGHIIVTDVSTKSVFVLDHNGRLVRRFGCGEFVSPEYVAVDSKKRIFVSDSGTHRVKMFDNFGKGLGEIGAQGTNDGQLDAPRGIAVDSSDNILVVDSQNNRVSKFDSSGKFIEHTLQATDISGELIGLALASSGLLGVTTKSKSVVAVYPY